MNDFTTPRRKGILVAPPRTVQKDELDLLMEHMYQPDVVAEMQLTPKDPDYTEFMANHYDDCMDMDYQEQDREFGK